MDQAQRTTRTYHSTLREQQAEHTRQLIADAARAAFLERGWSGTSVRAVAQAAGVSQATVFNVYGNKAGLAMSMVDSIDAAAGTDQVMAELMAGEGDPPAQLRALIDFDRRLFEHGGAVIRVMMEGRREHPDLAAAYEGGRGRGESNRRRVFSSWPKRAWRRGVTVDRALDTYAILCSVATFDIAVTERGWSPEQVEQWWFDTLAELLLA